VLPPPRRRGHGSVAERVLAPGGSWPLPWRHVLRPRWLDQFPHARSPCCSCWSGGSYTSTGSAEEFVGSPRNTSSPSSEETSPPSSLVQYAPLVQPTPLSHFRTRLQTGIRHPKRYTDGTIRYGMLSSTCEPCTLTEALGDENWCNAMNEEYKALMDNKT
jgi:hypothetical protein